MAVFTIAKNVENMCIHKKECCYTHEKDLRNLLFYGYNRSKKTVWSNLYNLGIESIYYQFLYLQKRRVKPLTTRALHYILSFDTQGYEWDIGYKKLVDIMEMIPVQCFREYQCIEFLHMDKSTHFHIHIIVNPVNIHTLHVCRETFITTGNTIADWLGTMYEIPIQGFTYRNSYGHIVRGRETGSFLYMDKFMKKYNIKQIVWYGFSLYYMIRASIFEGGFCTSYMLVFTSILPLGLAIFIYYNNIKLVGHICSEENKTPL